MEAVVIFALIILIVGLYAERSLISTSTKMRFAEAIVFLAILIVLLWWLIPSAQMAREAALMPSD